MMDKEFKQQTSMLASLYQLCMSIVKMLVHIKLTIWPFSIIIFPKNYGILDKKRINEQEQHSQEKSTFINDIIIYFGRREEGMFGKERVVPTSFNLQSFLRPLIKG